MIVNCKNYFNEKSFQEVCEALESGKDVQIYIDCIGHTRSDYESKNYRDALKKKYGRRLQRHGDPVFNPYSYVLKS